MADVAEERITSTAPARSVARRARRHAIRHRAGARRTTVRRAATRPRSSPPPEDRRGAGQGWDQLRADWRHAHEGARRELVDDWRRLRAWWRSPDRRDRARTRRWLPILRSARFRQARWRRIERLAPDGLLRDPLVRSRLRYLSVRAAARDAHVDAYSAASAVIALVLLFVAVPLYLTAPLQVSWQWRLATTVGGFFAFALPATVITLIRPRAGIRTQLAALAAPGLGLLATSGAGFGPGPRPSALLESSAGVPADGLVVALRLGAVACLGAILIVLLSAGYDVALGYRWRRRRHPDMLAVEYLAALLDTLTRHRRDLADPRARRAMARNLDALADVIEHGFGAALRLPSADSDAVLRDRLRRLAAGIRSQQVAVATPELDTLPQLRRLVFACLGAVCTGRLGSLAAVVDAEPRPTRRRALAVVAALRSIVIALAPLALVAALFERGVLRLDGFGRAAVVAAGIWALAVVLMALDPQFTTRVEAVRDVMSALRGGDPKRPS